MLALSFLASGSHGRRRTLTALSTCCGLNRTIVAGRKPQCKRSPSSQLAFDGDRSVELLDDALRDGQTEAETPSLGRDEILEDLGQTVWRDTRTRVCHTDLDLVANASRSDDHSASWLRGLNGIRDQVPKHTSESKAIPFDDERL